MPDKRSKKLKAAIVIIVICATVFYLPVGMAVSKGLETEHITIAVGQSGAQIRVAHISDIHYPKYGIEPKQIADTVRSFAPDFVFLTGDIFDNDATNEDIAALGDFLAEMGALGQTYAVFGNHENDLKVIKLYKSTLEKCGITLLENEVSKTSVRGMPIVVAGLTDNGDWEQINLSEQRADAPILLLAHRPEKWDMYVSATKTQPLVAFSGHAHGGQIRIFGKGLYAHGAGYFPKYTDGLYEGKDINTYMVVSRGLGNSDFPIRAYNRYHLPLATILL